METASAFQLSIILSAINRTGGAFGAVERSASKMGGSIDRTKDAASKLFSMGSAASVAFGGWFVKQGMNLQDTKIRMETLLGSAEKAKGMMAELNDFANVTPYSNNQTYNAAIYLIPFTKDAKEIRKQLTMISDVAQGAHIPFEELAAKMANFKAQDVMFTQDLKELTNRGFNRDYLARAMGVDSTQLAKLAQDGKIHFKDIQKAFEIATSAGESYYQMTEKMSTTGSGRLSTALGTAEYAISNLALKGMPIITNLINTAIPAIDTLSRFVEAHEQWASAISGVVLAGAGLYPVIQSVRLLAGIGGTLLSGAGSVIQFTKALTLLKEAEAAGNMTQWYGAMEKYGGAGNLAARALQWAKIEQLGFNAATLLNPYVLGAAAFVAIGGGIAYYISKRKEQTAAERMSMQVQENALETAAKQKAGLHQSIDKLSQLQEGTSAYNIAMDDLQRTYGKYADSVNWAKQSQKDLPELSKKIAEGIDLEAQSMARAELTRQEYYAREKALMEAKQLSSNHNWADYIPASVPGVNELFGNASKSQDKFKEAAQHSANIQALNKMTNDASNNIQITTNLVVNDKVLATTVDNAKRSSDRTSFDKQE